MAGPPSGVCPRGLTWGLYTATLEPWVILGLALPREEVEGSFQTMEPLSPVGNTGLWGLEGSWQVGRWQWRAAPEVAVQPSTGRAPRPSVS